MHISTYKNGMSKNLKSKTAIWLWQNSYMLLAIVNVTFETQFYYTKSSTVVKS